MQWQFFLRSVLIAASSTAIVCTASDSAHASHVAERGSERNILLLIIDDAGFDQLTSFNYDRKTGEPNGMNPARTPTLDAIARGGVRL